MADVVLVALNARWSHASLGLRYLRANLGPLFERSEILEFEASAPTAEAAAAILRRRPRLVGIGVYVWNVREATDLATTLKRVAPDVTLVVGGPEVSFETDDQEIARVADHVVRGEADHAFRDLCLAVFDRDAPRPAKIVDAAPPDFAGLALPYALYDDVDLARRVVYVEASRGCPFECSFCLSALDVPTRAAPAEAFLAELAALHARGLRRFKFVDRTFNLNVRAARETLEFFLARATDDLFLHFEMVPDRFPDALRDVVRRFPAGTLQFEVGVQTLDPETAARIDRRTDAAKLEENLRFLRDETGVHVHADLIAGLPGESFESFAAGFDRLSALGPAEIQVGVLKRLRGTPLAARGAAHGMTYSAAPPYEVLRTDAVDFEGLLALKRFARTWDRVANSGEFLETTARLRAEASPFRAVFDLSERLHARTPAGASAALSKLVEEVFGWSLARGDDPREAASRLLRDYQRGGRTDRPPALRPHLPDPTATRDPAVPSSTRPGLERQDRRRR